LRNAQSKVAGTLSACGARSGHLAAAAARSESVRQRIIAAALGAAGARGQGAKESSQPNSSNRYLCHQRTTVRNQITAQQEPQVF
jgi:hypothetical protein